MTAQLTRLGMPKAEYARGYDWFHQGESLLLLYFLIMADPDRWAARAVGSPSCTSTRRTATMTPPAASSAARTMAPIRGGPACSTGPLPLAGPGSAFVRLPARLAAVRRRRRT
jgi:hypothetical protein